MLVQVTVDQRLGLNSAGLAAPEDPEYDIFADVSAKDPAIISAMYAMSLEPIEGLTLPLPSKVGSRLPPMARLMFRLAKRLPVRHQSKAIRLKSAPVCLR